MTWFLPEKDRTYTSKAKYLDELATLYGGRVAEERATQIARAMVMRFGFDVEVGPENLATESADGNFLGSDGGQKMISEETHRLIDGKVRLLLKDAYALATKIITENRELHEKIAEELLKKEEMLEDEFNVFFE